MENAWNLFNTNSSTIIDAASSSSSRGHNNLYTSNTWEPWDLASTRYDWCHVAQDPTAGRTSVYSGGNGSHYHPDPHLVCLNLGKRHYFEDAMTVADECHVDVAGKRGKPLVNNEAAGAVTVASVSNVEVGVPRCQVEGCHVKLSSAKEYHRRHKVCEKHSKAPRVVVLGVEQRFCQQCSRFHAISEFDDSKRSCRRRLAGHNERRRKGSYENSIIPKNPYPGHAHSLLSSTNIAWLSSFQDMSSRGSAALHELIAENRAAHFAQQLILERDIPFNQYNHPMEDNTIIVNSQNQIYSEPQGWNGHVTLDLMQAQSSAFGLSSIRGKSEGTEGCPELMWGSLGGSRVVFEILKC